MKENFRKKILSNGMTIIFEKRDLPIVSVAFGVRNGGVNESAEEKGISHFIEHMLFKGTPTRDSKKIAYEIEKNGGELNGFTSETATAFWCKMPYDKIDVALEVLSDVVKNPLFDENELEKERKVIFEEIKMYHDNPRMHIFDEMHRCLFGDPFGIPLIGTQETMNSIDRDKIIKKFKEIYTPNNLILSVVGKADFDKLVKFCEENFEGEKSEVPFYEFEEKNEEKEEERVGIDQANLVFAFHTPKSDDDKCYSAKVLSGVLAEGMSSRLFSEIREKRNLAYSIKGASSSSKYFGYNFIYVGTMKENVSKVKELILKEIENVSNDLEEKELNEVKEQLIGNFHIGMENSQDQMVSLLLDEIDGDVDKFYEFEDKIRNVKLEDVKDIAKNSLKEYSFYSLIPK